MATLDKGGSSEVLPRVLEDGRGKIVILQARGIQTDFYISTHRFELDNHNQNGVNGSHAFGNESSRGMEEEARCPGRWWVVVVQFYFSQRGPESEAKGMLGA